MLNKIANVEDVKFCQHGVMKVNRKQSVILTVILAALVAVSSGCGGSPTKTTNPGEPLDPQGNWIFTLTDSAQQHWTFAGQLFELVPPVVTSNGLGTLPNQSCQFTVTASGQASGTNSITLSLSAQDTNTPPSYTLAGTIAEDQAHMNGTFSSTNTQGCTLTGTGTWTAAQVPAVTGTWKGTATDGTVYTVTGTENTDQTSVDMGHFTGTMKIEGGACVVPGTYNLRNFSVHVGETFNAFATDPNGVTVSLISTVDPATNNAAPGFVSFDTGACSAQSFDVTLTKQ